MGFPAEMHLLFFFVLKTAWTKEYDSSLETRHY